MIIFIRTPITSSGHRFSKELSRRCLHRSNVVTDVATLTNTGIIMTPSGPLNVTNELTIVDTAESLKWPVFQVLQPNGQLSEGAVISDINKNHSVSMYTSMVRIQVLDDIMYHAQRQGRISFYMQAAGEEATHIGKHRCLC